MKTNRIIEISLASFILLVAQNSVGQSGLAVNTASTKVATMPATENVDNDRTYLVVNAEVTKTFYNVFGIASTNATWKETSNGYVATFTTGNRRTLAWFKKSGEMKSAGHYGSGEFLPLAERRLIEENYRGYDISYTVEIIAGNKTAWLVTIQNNSMIRIIKMADGNMHETKTMGKAKQPKH